MYPIKLNHLVPASTSRRGFLSATAVVTGALLIGFGPGSPAEAQAPAPAPGFKPYLRINPDNTVTVLVSQMDMGQGVYHGCATLVAEELGADWAQMRAEGAAGNLAAYGNIVWGGFLQGTGGSTSMATSFDRYRRAGAIARAVLVTAAAREWNVPPAEVTVDRGTLRHASGRSITFAGLIVKAATVTPPNDVKLKDAKDWVFIGNETLPHLNAAAKSTGKFDFTIDVKLPGMLTAVMIHPPLFGATLASFDAAKAKAMPGVVDVVAIPRGVAVVAKDMWSALQAREAVTARWNDAKAEKRSSPEFARLYRETAAKPGAAIARKLGEVPTAFAGAARTVEALYEFPYLAHAALEPLNAIARRNADGTLEVWGGHQLPDIYQNTAAGIAGVAPDKVRMHVMPTGGGFGRRAVMDSDIIVEAVSIAKAINWSAPVKVQWTREDDMRGGRYRPAYVHRLKAGIDKDGKIIAWQNHIVGQSIMAGTGMDDVYVKNGVDITSVEGANNLPYNMGAQLVELTTMSSAVPVLWWRAVGATHTSYAVECFLDEIAAATGKDPLALRMSMLDPASRFAGVLRMAADKADWGKPLAAGRFRGIAVSESFNSFVAHVAEISVGDKGRIKVERVVSAVDCGVVINPDMVRAQIEGGVGFGLGAIMKSQLTLDQGKVVEGNFDGYDVLRFDEMPKVEVHIVKSTEAPTGVGEPGVPPIGPAVANAIFAATRKPMRILPFTRAENA